ncbi:MAG: diphthine synthase, partial [Candidatus Poseidoniales archaeon]
MTERARSVARGCSKRYLEGYTAVLPQREEERLESVIGPWERLMRDKVEKPVELLASARSEAVALLVVGDPMQATTHIDLEARCAEQGIGFYVIPGLSVTALAVSLSGMQSYRFGRQVTLPFAVGDYLPTSPLEMLCNNFESGLHSLVLLDLDPTGMGVERPRPMSPAEAVGLLEKMVERLEGGEDGLRASLERPVREWSGILLSDLGTEQERVLSGQRGDLDVSGRAYLEAVPAGASCATQQVCAFSCHMSDTTDLEVEKTAKSADCKPGSTCTYTITMSNTGATPRSGPFSIRELLPNGATFVSVSPLPWTCAPDGASPANDVVCKYPPGMP